MALTVKQEVGVKEALKWWKDDKRRHNEVFKVLGFAGCLDKDSIIMTNKGDISLGELILDNPNNYESLDFKGFINYNGEYKVYNRKGDIVELSHVYATDIMDGFDITFEDSTNLKTSEIHPLLVKTENGEDWIKAKDLQVGMKCAGLGNKPFLHKGKINKTELTNMKNMFTDLFSFDKEESRDLEVNIESFDEDKKIAYIIEFLKSPGMCFSYDIGRVKFASSFKTVNDTLKLFIAEYGITVLEEVYNENTGFYESEVANFSMNNFLETFGEFLDKEVYSKLKEFIYEELDGDFVWKEIKSLIPIKQKFYDITVPEDHSFIANGMVNHNTGKTFLVEHIIDAIGVDRDNVRNVAFTGMAASVLTKRGNQATTIHKLIYDPYQDKYGKIHFSLKEDIGDIDLIVLDEISQVSQNLLDDLLSFNIPTISLGDPDQLPPVKSKANNLLENPHVFLDEVMRQALDNPITWAATQLRTGNQLAYGTHGEKLFVIPKEQITDEMMTETDQILTFKNKDIRDINEYVRREIYKLESPLPYKGEKLLCLKNNWNRTVSEKDINQDLVNGLMGYVTKIGKYNNNYESFDISFQPTYFEKEQFKNLKADGRYFLDGLTSDDIYYEDDKYKKMMIKRASLFKSSNTVINKFTYGYALSVFKSQGSEFESVLYIDEPLNKDIYWKSAYVGATRAKDTLIFAR
jgi:exodeoxyribonuclease-5